MKAIITRRPPRTARKLRRLDTSAVETRRSVSWAAMATTLQVQTFSQIATNSQRVQAFAQVQICLLVVQAAIPMYNVQGWLSANLSKISTGSKFWIINHCPPQLPSKLWKVVASENKKGIRWCVGRWGCRGWFNVGQKKVFFSPTRTPTQPESDAFHAMLLKRFILWPQSWRVLQTH